MAIERKVNVIPWQSFHSHFLLGCADSDDSLLHKIPETLGPAILIFLKNSHLG